MSDVPTRIRPMQPVDEDLNRYVDAFRRNGDDKSLRLLDWLYRRGPLKEVYVDFAVPADDADRLAAIYAVAAVRFDVDRERVVGVQSLDTLTDAGFRGKGLFTKLAADVFARCERDGVALVYGFPNASSAHGFFQRLGWVRLGPVPFLVLPLRPSYALRRMKLPRIPVLSGLCRPLPRAPALGRDEELRVVLSFDPAFDALWDAFATDTAVAVRRDATYLNWRFSKPGERYKTLALYRAGRLDGFVTFTVKDKHGGRVGYLLELLYRPGAEGAGQVLLAAATRELADDGAEVLLAWCLEHSPNRPTYRRAGFWDLPERLRPIALHFGVRRLAGQAGALGNRRNWYLSYCDSDTV